MKAIIEQPVRMFNCDSEFENACYNELPSILLIITKSKTETGLRRGMKTLFLESFTYGFGANHMWVHQLHNRKVVKSRIIFVEF